MIGPEKKNVVDDWLEAEAAESPDCKVIAVLRAATTSQKLEEHTALKNLRELCDAAPKEDVPR
jgi:hypothetical protein